MTTSPLGGEAVNPPGAGIPVVEEEDWETADLEASAPPAQSQPKPSSSRKALLKNLRPTAPAFQPPSSSSSTVSRDDLAEGANARQTDQTQVGRTLPMRTNLPTRPGASPSTSTEHSSSQACGPQAQTSFAFQIDGGEPSSTSRTNTILLQRSSDTSFSSSGSRPSSSAGPSSSVVNTTRSNPASSDPPRAGAVLGLAAGSRKESMSGANGDGESEYQSRVKESMVDPWSRPPALERGSNKQIWTAANTIVPTIAIPSLSTGPNTPALPPPTSLRILRRDNPNNNKNSSTASSSTSGASSPLGSAAGAVGGERENEMEKRKKTLEEREEEYRKARERIFGIEASGGDASGGADVELGSTSLAHRPEGSRPGTSPPAGEDGAGVSASGTNELARSATGSVVSLSSSGGADGPTDGNTISAGNKVVGMTDVDGRAHGDVDSRSNVDPNRRSQSSSRQSTPGQGSVSSHSGSAVAINNNNAPRKPVSNPGGGRRPGRGEGSAFEMLRPPPDSAYRVSARSQGLVGSGGHAAGPPLGQMGYGGGVVGGVIRQPMGPDELNAVGFAAAQRYGHVNGLGPFVGAQGQAGQAYTPDYGYAYGSATANQYQQAAYMQQHQQAQMQLQFQQMQLQGMMSPQQMQAYGAPTGGYNDPGAYLAQVGYGVSNIGGERDLGAKSRTGYGPQGFVQGRAPTGLASSMTTHGDPAFVVQPQPGQPNHRAGPGGSSYQNPQMDFPALPGNGIRPGTLSSRSSSSSGSRGNGEKRSARAWGAAGRG